MRVDRAAHVTIHVVISMPNLIGWPFVDFKTYYLAEALEAMAMWAWRKRHNQHRWATFNSLKDLYTLRTDQSDSKDRIEVIPRTTFTPVRVIPDGRRRVNGIPKLLGRPAPWRPPGPRPKKIKQDAAI